MIYKICTTWPGCYYRNTTDSTAISDKRICKYEGYCDFQLPRDSRKADIMPTKVEEIESEDEEMKNEDSKNKEK